MNRALAAMTVFLVSSTGLGSAACSDDETSSQGDDCDLCAPPAN